MSQYRLTFKKGKGIRFISHLDMVKLLERAVRRAVIPISFSQGFNPHPKMSFALPVPVGVTADEEYIDMELREDWDNEKLKERLNANLPPEMRILKVEQKPGREATMALVRQAEYRIDMLLHDNRSLRSEQELCAMLQEFAERNEILIEKQTKKQLKTINLAAGLFALKLEDYSVCSEGCRVRITCRLQAGNEGNIRAEDLLKALRQYLQLDIDTDTVRIHRKRLLLAEPEKQ